MKVIHRKLLSGIFICSLLFPPVFVGAQVPDKTKTPKPSPSLDLAFDATGRVKKIYVAVGDKITAGQTLIDLDTSEVAAQLEQAKAIVAVEKAKLDQLKNGSPAEQVTVSELKLKKGKIIVEGAKKDVVEALQDAYAKAEDAITNKTDQVFISNNSNNIQSSFLIPFYADSQTQVDIQNKRFLLVDKILISWKASLNDLSVSADMNSYMSTGAANLRQIRGYLNIVIALLNNNIGPFSVASFKTWKTDAYAARTDINTAMKNLLAAEKKLKEAQSDVDLLEYDLAQKKTGSSGNQTVVQEAQLKQAEAQVELIQAKLNKMSLVSPVNGIVIKQNAKRGMVISGPVLLISIVPDKRK